MNLINFQDLAITHTSIWGIILLGIIAITIIALIITTIKKNKTQPQNENNGTNETKKKTRVNNSPKEIPIKKTSIIEDPANIRIAIEESKADLSEFNVKNEEIITEETITKIKKKSEHNEISNNIEELIIDENNNENEDNEII